jgi:hypothetical protein
VTDQPAVDPAATTPEPEPPDDPNVPDAELPRADRDAIRDTARQLIDGTMQTGSDDFAALPARVRRRAWLRYQAHFEAAESDRERAARGAVKVENAEADRLERREVRRRERLREREIERDAGVTRAENGSADADADARGTG